jgi:WXG100 family type VII secretion target
MVSGLPVGIDADRVDELASQVEAQRDVIVESLNNLRAINADLDTAWDGKAQETFRETYGNWIQQLENYNETLINVKSYLNSVAQNFRDLDAAAAQAASGATMAE